jgi:hypothetical protein
MSEVNPDVSYTQNPALVAGNTVESLNPVHANPEPTGLPSAEDLDRAAEEIELIANAQKALFVSNKVATQGPSTTDALAGVVAAIRAELDDLNERIAKFNRQSGQKI